MAIILIVEDDINLQKIYTEKLKLEGFEVTSTASGKEGLTSVKDKKPDLILLDIMLGGNFNGFDFLELLKKDESAKKIPVIVLTNLDSEEKVARDIGASEYLVKANTGIDELVNKVRSYIH